MKIFGVRNDEVRNYSESPCMKWYSECTKWIFLLNFDKNTQSRVYIRQTDEPKEKHISNCPLCAIGHDANKEKIWTQKEMDADHVLAWSKGGAIDESNCQMLCKTHNRAKGNR